ncbi:transmembrane protein 45A-like [Perognathus longimembris pacificus]|uniref:transmembrane protein 45A-like n=1 Tax=Perognathus longimembris pacificus TaxID=214514 RepID=UPI0020195446|nr:transmembrane protein 45A-like [Perognathus longimembris pacificus]
MLKLPLESVESCHLDSALLNMGDFLGHGLAGSFYVILGLWWYIKIIFMYVCKKQAQTCYHRSEAFFQRAEILEGTICLVMVLTGGTGLLTYSGSTEMTLRKEGQWIQLKRFQHLTIYLFFGLWAVTNILCFTIKSIPISLTKLMLTNAFSAGAFILYTHPHSPQVVDILLHELLCLAIFLAGLVSFIEVLIKENIMLALLRSSFTILHGSWFCQLAFVLYPPTGVLAWDLNDHINSVFFTICFCWHYAFIYVIMGVVYVAVTWFVKWRIRKPYPSEVVLLKNAEREEESEEEM